MSNEFKINKNHLLLGGFGGLIFGIGAMLAGIIGLIISIYRFVITISFLISTNFLGLLFISLGFRQIYYIKKQDFSKAIYIISWITFFIFGFNIYTAPILIFLIGLFLNSIKDTNKYNSIIRFAAVIHIICGFIGTALVVAGIIISPPPWNPNSPPPAYTFCLFSFIFYGFPGIFLGSFFFNEHKFLSEREKPEIPIIEEPLIGEPLIEEPRFSWTYKGQQIFYIIAILVLILLDIAFIIDILNPVYRNRAQWVAFWITVIVCYSLTIIFTLLLIRASKKIKEGGMVRDYIMAANSTKKKAIKSNEKGDIEKAIIRWNKSIELLEKGKVEANKYNPSLIPKIDDEIEIVQSFISNISTETRTPTEIWTPTEKITPPIEEDLRKYVVKKDIILKRGGEIQGGKYIFKIKVENKTDSNITDLNFQIISYPRDSINLIGDKFREISKLNAGGLVSPTFEFQPTRDCIVGTIHSTVSYIDHSDNLHTKKVEPHEISIVCGLLQPREIDVSEFMKVCQELLDYEKVGEEIKIPYNSKLIFEKLKVLLPEQNFMFVTNPESKIIGDTFFGEINGFAEGKFNRKCVGIKITITGKVGQNSSIGMIEGFAQDKSMLPSLLSELGEKIIYWYCKRCKGPLEMEDVEKLLRNELVKCRYCDNVMSKLL